MDLDHICPGCGRPSIANVGRQESVRADGLSDLRLKPAGQADGLTLKRVFPLGSGTVGYKYDGTHVILSPTSTPEQKAAALSMVNRSREQLMEDAGILGVNVAPTMKTEHIARLITEECERRGITIPVDASSADVATLAGGKKKREKAGVA